MKETERNAVCILVLYLVLWYVGAMFSFFPFIANDLAIAAVGFAGLLIVAAIVICTCWVIETIQKTAK